MTEREEDEIDKHIKELRSALRVLLHEVIQAGFGTAKDYNWPQAIAGARSALGDPNAG
jgi:hypothetical protein